MKKLIGLLIAALIPLAGGLAVVPAAPAVASPVAPATSTPSWASLQQTALQVTAGYRGDGPLTVTGAAGPVADSTATTASGRISVAQRTVVATDRSGTVLLQLVLLGGSQLVVDETSPAADYQGETLVLQPGSSAVVGTYPLPGAAPATAATAVDRSHRRAAGTEAVLATSRGDHRPTARLVTVGGCYGDPQTPGVIGSTYGLLVQGEGVVKCLTSESMSVIAGLYQSSTELGTAGGSRTGTYLGVNVYHGCSLITGTNPFHTAELWGINGVLQGGGTSSTANLHCA